MAEVPLTPGQIQAANQLCQNQFAQTAELRYDVWDLWKSPAVGVATLTKISSHCLINQSFAMGWKKEDIDSTFYSTTDVATGETRVDASGCKLKLRPILKEMARRSYGWNVDHPTASLQLDEVTNYNCDNAAPWRSIRGS